MKGKTSDQRIEKTTWFDVKIGLKFVSNFALMIEMSKQKIVSSNISEKIAALIHAQDSYKQLCFL